MASRIVARYVSRRLSSGGKIFSEEEKAAENVYIKKIEQEKLEKLARKGPRPGEQPPAAPEAAASDAKPSGPASSATGGVSSGKLKNYAAVAGALAGVSAVGWWFLSRPKKSEEIAD